MGQLLTFKTQHETQFMTNLNLTKKEIAAVIIDGKVTRELRVYVAVHSDRRRRCRQAGRCSGTDGWVRPLHTWLRCGKANSCTGQLQLDTFDLINISTTSSILII